MTDTVMLRNGYVTKRHDVPNTFLLVQQLLDHDIVAFHELVSVCRNPAHRIDTESMQILLDSTLVVKVLPAGKQALITDHTRNVVISMIENRGTKFRLIDPIADGQTPHLRIVR